MILWNLKRRLKRIGERAAPDREFVLRLQAHLGEAGYFSVRSPFVLPVWRSAMASVAVICSLGMGTASYAYASDTVLPDHPLYGVRLSLEAIENHLTFSAQQQEQVRLKHTYRRLSEVRLMAMKNHALDADHADKVVNSLAEAAKIMQAGVPVEEGSIGSVEDLAVSSSDLPEASVEHAMTASSEDLEDKKDDGRLLIRQMDDLDHQLKRMEEMKLGEDSKKSQASTREADEVEPIEDAEDQI